jgi:inner membrane protein
MPGIGHLAVGLAAARVTRPPAGLGRSLWTALLVAASSAPDLDVLAFPLGIPYGATLGHRGATHSLIFAGLSGCALGLAARRWNLSAVRVALTVSLVIATHGILDTFTNGGRGVALLWPLTGERFFAPWRPIPVSPLAWGIFSRRGFDVMSYECLLFLPLFVIAAWPRRRAEDSV